VCHQWRRCRLRHRPAAPDRASDHGSGSVAIHRSALLPSSVLHPADRTAGLLRLPPRVLRDGGVQRPPRSGVDRDPRGTEPACAGVLAGLGVFSIATFGVGPVFTYLNSVGTWAVTGRLPNTNELVYTDPAVYSLRNILEAVPGGGKFVAFVILVLLLALVAL